MTLREWCERIQARVDAASPGPWMAEENDQGEQCLFGTTYDDWIALLPHQCVRAIEEQRIKDAAFIVSARTVLPQLLDRLRLCVDALERISGELDGSVEHPVTLDAMDMADAALADVED